ncbi:hypothetical protein MHYP_G00362080 [Metynnis hypsauchen]
MWRTEVRFTRRGPGVSVLVIEAQPVDGVRPVTALAPPGCGSSRSRVVWECSPKRVSARGIQPGGVGRPRRFARAFSSGLLSGGFQGRPPSGAGPRPPSGAFPPWRCAATGSGSAWKGQGAKVARELRLASFTAPSRPDFAVYPGAAGEYLRAFPPRGEGRGPSAPDAAVDRAGLSSVRVQPRRAARAGTGLRTKGARGRRRCRLPTRPVLKHGPRSLTRARVKGLKETPRRNEGEGRRTPAEVGSPPYGARGRTTGPSLPLRRGGGARAHAMVPERW